MVSGSLSANDELSTWGKISQHFKDNKKFYFCAGAVCVAASAAALASYFGAEENNNFAENYCPPHISNPCWRVAPFSGDTFIELGSQSKSGYEEFLTLLENCLDDSGKKCVSGPWSFEYMQASQFSFDTVDCSGHGMRSYEDSYLSETGTDCDYSMYVKIGRVFQKVGTLSFDLLRFRKT